MNCKISVIIPVRDEEPNLEGLCSRLAAALRATACSHEIIFVDDGSADQSLALLRRLEKGVAGVRVAALGRRLGQGAACCAGFARASGDIIVTLDADLQNDPAEIGLFLDRLRAGCDFVSGRRVGRRGGRLRGAVSWAANQIGRAVSGVDLRDHGCGFAAFKRELLAALNGRPPLRSALFLKCLLAAAAKRPEEVAVTHFSRRQAHSKYGLAGIVRSAWFFLRDYALEKSDPFLLAALAAAALARYWGIGFGLPNPGCRPDENLIISQALNVCGGHFNPRSFQYPSLYIYLTAALCYAYFLGGLALGRFQALADMAAEHVICPSNLYLLDRTLSAGFGTATVAVVYAAAGRLFGKTAARAAAWFMSLAYLGVRESHFGVTDTTMTFFIMCSALFIIKSYQNGRRKDFVLAGIFAGLAAATKYAGVILLLPAYLACALRPRDAGLRPARFGTLFAAPLALAFLCGTPFALPESRAFISDLSLQAAHLFQGDALNLGRGWRYHLLFTLRHGLGPGLLAAALAGSALAAWRKPRETLVFCAFPAAYYALIGAGYTVFVRYALPLVPFICVMAAAAVAALHERLLRYCAARPAGLATVLFAALLLAPSLRNVFLCDRLLAQKDSRVLAAQWISDHVPDNSSILQTSVWGALSLLTSSLQERAEDRSLWIGTYEARHIADYARRRKIKAYQQWLVQDNLRLSCRDKALPDFVVLAQHPLPIFGMTPANLIALTADCYTLRQIFVAIDMNCRANQFDRIDAFYLPFAGFQNIARPGPNIFIFEKTAKP